MSDLQGWHEDIAPAVGCIILNWNGWRDTTKCLQALRHCTYPRLSVIVVDNGSTDGSVAQIRQAHPDITVLESGANLGFSRGNNIGIRYALRQGMDYVWLLNNDTEPAANALAALVAKATSDPQIGAVASICYYADSPSRVQAWAGARINLWIGYGRNSVKPRSDDWFDALYGASMLVASAALREVGLLDPGFFLYWEETELCIRLRRGGWRLAAAPDSRVLHSLNASTGGNKLVLDRYFTASGLRILRLHSRAPELAMIVFVAIRFTRRLVRLQVARCLSVWRGIQDYIHAPLHPLEP